jgi:hypothetical protein
MESLTTEYLAAQITDAIYLQPIGTLTLCILTMANGLNIVGQSACLNPARFDAAIGRSIAYQDAFRQLWQLEGYARANGARI